jgi:hypothetical protein
MRLPGTTVFLLISALTALSSTADLPCSFIIYQIAGSVIDCDGRPLEGAQVILFIEDESDAWLPSGAPVLTTSPEGRFSGEFWLNMYSGPGMSYAERCSRRLKRFTVVASKEAFVTMRKNIGQAGIPEIDAEMRAKIEVPTLRLHQVIRQGCR